MLKLFHIAPFIRLLLFLILGILIEKYYSINTCFFYLLFLGLAFISISYLPFFFRRYKFRFLFGVGLFLVLTSIGIYLQKEEDSLRQWIMESESKLYNVLIIEEPIHKPATIKFNAEIVNAPSDILPYVINKKISVFLKSDVNSQALHAGDRIVFYAQSKNAPYYLKSKLLAAQVYVKSENWILEKSSFYKPFSLRALYLRRVLLDRLREIVADNNYYSIAAALVFGYKNDINKELRESFSNIGAGHVLAVSGLHFSVIFGMFYFFLSPISNSFRGKIIKQIILFPLMWGFAFLTGFSPSVIRASLMLSIWSLGNVFSSRSFSLNTIASSAFIMLLLSPAYLFDVGFQLSFSAVISIVLVNPYLVNLYTTKSLLLKYFWSLVCVSVSAQLGVLPLSIYYFGQIPLVFLVTNICVIPVVTILLFLIPFALFINYLFMNFTFLITLLNKVLEFFLFLVYFLDNLPFRSIDEIKIDLSGIFLIYSFLFSLLFTLFQKRIVYFCFFLIIVLCWLIYYLCPV